jgi:polysaccharide pyruvyl transferase WcaK-like protein
LRDWPDKQYLNTFLSVANDLRNEGITVKFYSFDRAADKHLITLLQNDDELHVWDPAGSLTKYLQSLASNALVVTSRAHGAILSACLGVPGFCIEIEPKLRNVSQMLPESYDLLRPPFNAAVIKNEILTKLAKVDAHRAKVLSDVAKNKLLAEKSLQLLRSFVAAGYKS